jgi:hypothetical protein
MRAFHIHTDLDLIDLKPEVVRVLDQDNQIQIPSGKTHPAKDRMIELDLGLPEVVSQATAANAGKYHGH